MTSKRVGSLLLLVAVATCAWYNNAQGQNLDETSVSFVESSYGAAPNPWSAQVSIPPTTTTTTQPPVTTTTQPPAAPKPKPTTPAAPKPSQSHTAPARAPPEGSGIYYRLADCESGDINVPGSADWSANTGNGFYGGLQFTLSTWKGYGGTGMPQDASASTQVAIAIKVQASQGWGAWPSCSRQLGLR